jgi:hypothetical protein
LIGLVASVSMIVGGIAATAIAPSAAALVVPTGVSSSGNSSETPQNCEDGKVYNAQKKACEDSHEGDNCKSDKPRSEAGNCEDGHEGDNCKSDKPRSEAGNCDDSEEHCQASSAGTASELCPPVVDPCTESQTLTDGVCVNNPTTPTSPETPTTPTSPETAVTTAQEQPATVDAVTVEAPVVVPILPEAGSLPVVEQPVLAVAVQPAKVTAATTPVAATIPSAVNAGGGSDAPNGLPLWSVALMIAGLLGSVIAGSRLVVARKGS